jgi:hypothetical protein
VIAPKFDELSEKYPDVVFLKVSMFMYSNVSYHTINIVGRVLVLRSFSSGFWLLASGF